MTPPIMILPDRAQRRRCLASLLFLAASVSLVSLPAGANDLRLGAAAPPLVLSTLDGQHIATRDLLGDVVIVTFWATWCGPCIEEMPLLSDYAARHAQQGLKVLGFSLDSPDDLAKVRAMAAKLSFPVGLLGSAYAGGYGRMWRLPVSFVIDRSGRLVDNGWDDAQPVWTKERLQRIVDPLLLRKNQAPTN